MTTYVPLLAQQITSSTAVIGMVIAAEGLVALLVPIAAGAWSDQLKTRMGGRLPFLLLGAPTVGMTVALRGFMHSLGLLALVVFVFFIAYYWAYEPYRALYPDMLTAEIAARGQSTQAIFRGLATGTALIGGGLLIVLFLTAGMGLTMSAAVGVIAIVVVLILIAAAVRRLRRRDDPDARIRDPAADARGGARTDHRLLFLPPRAGNTPRSSPGGPGDHRCARCCHRRMAMPRCGSCAQRRSSPALHSWRRSRPARLNCAANGRTRHAGRRRTRRRRDGPDRAKRGSGFFARCRG